MSSTIPLKPFNILHAASFDAKRPAKALDAQKLGTVGEKQVPGSAEEVHLLMYHKLGENGDGLAAKKVRVEISVVFLKVGEIDTLKEQYEADVMVRAKWREPALDKSQGEVSYPVDWSKYWNPNLFIENIIGDPKESVFQMLTYNPKGEAFVCEKRRIKGVFLENLELNDFPFDVQDLTVTVMSDRPALEIELAEDPNELHRVNRQSFIDEQEWRLYKYIETCFREIANEYADPSIRKNALSVMCRAARRPAYFFWNIFLITFLISSLSFATFAVERSKPQNRLQLSFTLVLTSVAFKFVVNQSLPKISYLTYLDKYVLAAMIMLSTVCAWHGLITVVDKDDSIGDKVDFGALILFAAVYITFNVVFTLRIYTGPGKKRRLMKRNEREYVEKIRQQMLKRSQSEKYGMDAFVHTGTGTSI